jgi:hypothetical protein
MPMPDELQDQIEALTETGVVALEALACSNGKEQQDLPQTLLARHARAISYLASELYDQLKVQEFKPDEAVKIVAAYVGGLASK